MPPSVNAPLGSVFIASASFLAQVDSIQAERHDAHSAKIDAEQPRSMSSSPGAIGSGVSTSALRPMVSPRQGGNLPFTAIANRVRKRSYDFWVPSISTGCRAMSTTLCAVPSSGIRLIRARAPVVPQDLERRLAELLASLETRACLLQRGLAELDQLILNHRASSPGSPWVNVRDKL